MALKARLFKADNPVDVDLVLDVLKSLEPDERVQCKLDPLQKRCWYLKGVKENMFEVYSNSRKPEDTMLSNQCWILVEEV